MEFDNSFEVTAPIDEVFKTMLDVERVAPCVPGAKVVEQTSDDAYKVEIKIKLGPVSMTYKGDVQIVEADESAHRAVLAIKAREARGQGTATAKSELSLSAEGEGTRAAIHTDVSLTGRAASMSRGIIGDVSAKMLDTFASNLAAMLAPAAESGNGAGPAEAKAETTAEPDAPAAESSASAPPPPPPPPPPAREPEALDAGALGAQLVVERLRDPRVLAVLAAAVLFVVLRRLRRS